MIDAVDIGGKLMGEGEGRGREGGEYKVGGWVDGFI